MNSSLIVRSASQGALHLSPVLAFGPRSALRMPPSPASAASSPTAGGSTTAGQHAAPNQISPTMTAQEPPASQSVSTSTASKGPPSIDPLELGFVAAHGKGRHLHEDV